LTTVSMTDATGRCTPFRIEADGRGG
jgi:hypothetical protein